MIHPRLGMAMRRAIKRGRVIIPGHAKVGPPGTSMSDEIRNRDQTVAMGTERTGGRRDNVIALTAAAPRMKQLANELTHQYVVTYGRPEKLIPAEKIEVTVTKPGLTARAKTRTGQAGAK